MVDAEEAPGASVDGVSDQLNQLDPRSLDPTSQGQQRPAAHHPANHHVLVGGSATSAAMFRTSRRTGRRPWGRRLLRLLGQGQRDRVSVGGDGGHVVDHQVIDDTLAVLDMVHAMKRVSHTLLPVTSTRRRARSLSLQDGVRCLFEKRKIKTKEGKRKAIL